MANEVRNYFLAPSWDIPPDSLILVGNIIVSPKLPVPTLVKPTELQPPSNGDIQTRTTKTNVAWTREKASSGRFGIWTKFLVLLGVDVGTAFSKDSNEQFQFREMTTEECFPTNEYLQAAVDAKPVKDYLNRHSLNPKPLYVVVGVKTVVGARVSRSSGRTASAESGFGVDAAAVGSPVPVSVGPEAAFSRSSRDTVSFDGSSDFVFAFRVRKLIVKSKEIVQKDENRGAMFGESDGETDYSSSFEVVGIDDKDHADASDRCVEETAAT
ncbi:hypothetical protein PG985_012068 [Apiospora marii]|uniref:Uncharacterized protein n=1 Tax=Apiospora marii TaxID=335849 RepID=A0ABR1REN0_9PEZI